MKEVVKLTKAVGYKVADVKDFTYIFYIDSVDKNNYVITGKDNASSHDFS